MTARETPAGATPYKTRPYATQKAACHDAEKHLTKHCINMSDEVYTCMVDGVRCIDWIEQCTRGEMMQLGLSLLNIE